MPTEKLLTVGDGRTLAYDDGGNISSSIVVIFLTGMLSVGRVGRIFPVFQEKDVHFIAPTLPGYGNTSPIPNGKSYAATIASDMSYLLDHLHPNTSNMELYISGGSFGTVAAQMLFGAPFNTFPQGRYINAMLLLGAFPPFRDDEKEHFKYTQSMTWPNYFNIGPLSRFIPFRLSQHLVKVFIESKISTQESTEAFIREFIFNKMDQHERDMYKAWREKTGYEAGQLEREMAESIRKSVEKSWEGFLSTRDVLNSDWGWGRELGNLDEEHSTKRRVMIVAGDKDTETTLEWAKYLSSKYVNARLKEVSGGHIAAVFEMDEIWAEFMEA